MCLDAVGRAVRPLAALLVERESRGQFSDLGADALPEAYRRYLVNDLRETFGLPGTPIRLALREKKNPFARRKTRARRPNYKNRV